MGMRKGLNSLFPSKLNYSIHSLFYLIYYGGHFSYPSPLEYNNKEFFNAAPEQNVKQSSKQLGSKQGFYGWSHLDITTVQGLTSGVIL